MSAKPRLRIVGGVLVESNPRIAQARLRHGRPFYCERGGHLQYTKGPSFWTPERVSRLHAENEARRKAR